jgi:hypothetical protein
MTCHNKRKVSLSFALFGPSVRTFDYLRLHYAQSLWGVVTSRVGKPNNINLPRSSRLLQSTLPLQTDSISCLETEILECQKGDLIKSNERKQKKTKVSLI